MPSPTNYPFRQVLTLCLRQIILAQLVPAINADLQTQMTAAGIAPRLIPAFDDSSVVIGDLSPVAQATMCLISSSETVERLASEGLFYMTLNTQIRIKTVTVADNAPEDYEVLSMICSDTMIDGLCNGANSVIVPKTPGGQLLLPAGLAFQDCYSTGGWSQPFPQREGDKVTYTKGKVIGHRAGISFFQNRPNSLGA